MRQKEMVKFCINALAVWSVVALRTTSLPLLPLSLEVSGGCDEKDLLQTSRTPEQAVFQLSMWVPGVGSLWLAGCCDEPAQPKKLRGWSWQVQASL